VFDDENVLNRVAALIMVDAHHDAKRSAASRAHNHATDATVTRGHDLDRP